jgi:1-acyl-sn-glycerol-3-phosphate acyltransferase
LKLIVYLVLKNIFRYYNRIYFRSVNVYGKNNIPTDGGVLFSPNHQGALLDPLVLASLTQGKTTSLTRSDIFGGPFQWFLDAFYMLPVYRIRNGYSNLKKNDATFAKCYELLGLGKFMLMFSEGGHHNEYYLQNLSKGSSRLAFKAAQKNPGKKIYLQPVGINYGHHQQPRCTLHLVYGQPIEVSDFVDLKLTDVENINILKLELQNRMKACLWLPDKTENYFIQKKKINRHTTHVDFKTLKSALQNNYNKMPGVKPKSKTRKVLIFLLSVPNIIPLWISRKIIGKLEDIVFVSSLKYVLGVFLFPIWWLATSITIAYMYGNRVMTTYLLVCTLSLFIKQRFSLS